MIATKVLVVAPPKVAADTWSTEASKWDHLKFLRVVKLEKGNIAKRVKDLHGEGDVWVVSRNLLEWVFEQYTKQNKSGKWRWVKKWPFDVVILDESKAYSSPTGTWHMTARRIMRETKQLIELTGTPAPNDYDALWGQVFLMDGGARLGKTIADFRKRFMEPGGYVQTSRGLQVTKWVPRDGARAIIQAVLSDICVSMKATDWLNMPDVISRVVRVRIPMNRYEQMQKTRLIAEMGVRAKNKGALGSKLMQIANGAVYDDYSKVHHIHDVKLEALKEICEAGERVLVFTIFKHDTDRIKAAFPEARVLIDSDDISEWNRGEIKMMLAHPASAGHGLNIQAGGHTIVWFGLTYDLELYQQANARLWRQGQKSPSVIIHHIVAEGTLDERIMEVLEGKAEIQDVLKEALKYDGFEGDVAGVLQEWKDAR